MLNVCILKFNINFVVVFNCFLECDIDRDIYQEFCLTGDDKSHMHDFIYSIKYIQINIDFSQ